MPSIIPTLWEKLDALHERIRRLVIARHEVRVSFLEDQRARLGPDARRLFAAGISLVLHLCLLVLLLLQPPSKGTAAKGMGLHAAANALDGQGMDVSLTSHRRLETAQLKTPETEEFDAGLVQIDSLVVPPIADVSISAILDPSIVEPAHAPSLPTAILAQSHSAVQNTGGALGNQTTSGKGSVLPDQAIGELWKAIEPCWVRLADRNTAGVTVQVSFTLLGNPAVTSTRTSLPQGGVASNSSPSELLALNALAECGPYLMVYGQNNVEIAFPAGG